MFTRAIVRPPAPNFAEGLSSAGLGKPDFLKALEQHARYCATLEKCGMAITRLPANPDYPDSTFVEDTAIVSARGAILTRPGAASRVGEVASIADALHAFYAGARTITAPGTVDGGDVCQVANHFFIGLSERTNADGADQLAGFLADQGFTSSKISIHGIDGILHLKSAISYLGDRRLVVIDALAEHAEFAAYEIVRVAAEESYAANFLCVNEHVIVSSGHPKFEAQLRTLGYPVIALDMSEFRKMDGALSCLSLRF